MMKKYVLLILLSFTSFLFLGLSFLFFTNKGLIAGLHLAEYLIPGQFTVAVVNGRLADQFVLEGIHFADEEAAVTIDKLSVVWNPAALLKKELVARSVDIHSLDFKMKGAETADNKAVDHEIIFPSLALPLFVRIDKAKCTSLKITLSDDSAPIILDSLTLADSTAGDSRLQLGRLDILAQTYNISARGHVETEETLLTRLSLDYSLRPEGYGAIEGDGILTGSLKELNIYTQIQEPFQGTLQGTIIDLAGESGWQAELRADHAILSEISSDWPQFAFSKFKANGGGTWPDYTFYAEADADYDDFKNIHVQTKINGNQNGLQFTDTLLSRMNGKLTGQGQFNWEEIFTWQVVATGKFIKLSGINPDWPGIIFPEIILNGQGEQDRYTLKVQTDAEYDNIQDIYVASEITGDANGLQLTDIKLNHTVEELVGDVQLDWQDVLHWRASFVGKRLNPAVIEPQWNGSLDIQFLTEGKLTDSKMNGNFTLVSLDGELRGHPVNAQGKVTVDGDNFDIEDFLLKTTGTELKASGYVGETMGMNFQVESSDLSALWPELEGGIKADGFLSGTRQQPAIQMNVFGGELLAYGNSIKTLDGEIISDLSPDGRVNAAVIASQIMLAGKRIDTLSLDIQGKVEDHKLQIDASGDDGIISLELAGGWAEEIWNGEFSRTEVHADRYGSWHLQKPGSVKISGSEFAISNYCMTGAEDALVCFDGRQDQTAHWQASTKIKDFPLSFLSGVVRNNQNLLVKGNLSGNLSLAGSNRKIQSGELLLSTDNTSVQLYQPEEVKHELVWRDNLLHGVFAEDRLTAEITSTLQDGSTVLASVKVDNFSPVSTNMEKMKLQGTVNVNIFELNPLSALTFPLVEPKGSFVSKITLGGTVAFPLLDGLAKLDNGKIIVPQLGITLEDLNIQVNSNEQLIKLNVSGSSGEGSLQAEGELAIETGKADSLELMIRGDKFEMVNLPELKLSVAPQLSMKLSRQEGEVHGSLQISEGIISPYTFSGSVSPSRDVVFSTADETDGIERWPFLANVTIVVDDKVQVNAFGLRGRLAGEIQVVELPGKAVTGTGNLDVVEGTFSVYGRELQIKTGRLLYSGGPIDNPGVSVRAENRTRGVTTGIAVSGFLQQPEITFYSDPPMEQNEIISRLLMNTTLVSSSTEESGFIESMTAGTGLDPLSSTISEVKGTLRVDDVRVESGKTSEDLSLVIGTWMTPSLYISYGKNLLKESGTFNTRYVLGHGFSIETETGSTESGFDLKYEIDR